MPTALAEPPVPLLAAAEADEAALAWPRKNFEYVDGMWRVKRMSMKSVRIGTVVVACFEEYLGRNPIGMAFGNGMHYRCFPHAPRQVRIPDASLVLNERLPKGDVGVFRFPPDLAVEVVSPHDNANIIKRRETDFRKAGTPIVWVVFPHSQTVSSYGPQGIREFGMEDGLDAEPVLPGFRVPAAQLFNP